MINPDMSQYLDVFLDEGREQLALLESNILEMERGNHTSEMLQVLFRAAHTLKGSSRAMGFLAIGDLTHEMENILDALRLGQLEVTTPIVNVLLDCLDALAALVDSVGASGTDTGATDKDIPALVARLDTLRTGAAAADGLAADAPEPTTSPETAQEASFLLTEHEQAGLEAAREAGLSVYQVAVTLSTDCLMKSVRAWMVLSALEPLGIVLASDPGEDALETEEFGQTFRLLFAAEAELAQTEAALGGLSELELVIVQPWEAAIPAQARAAEAPPAPEPPPVAVLPAPSSPTLNIPTQDKPAADKPAASQTIRVEVSRLDSLLNLVGELVIERAQIHRISGEMRRRYPRDEEVGQLLETTHRVARVTSELQDQIMKARMLPIDGVFQRLPRMVRDLAQKTGKEVQFEMQGGETELDRTVLEVLSDPLIHLLRNSVDHGIEPPEERALAGKPAQGVVTLSARHEENHIVIAIEDDGRGMDPAKLKASAVRKGLLTETAAAAMSDRDALGLIFASGFSTAAVLSDISGRGVGMDIVKSNLERVGGRVLVDSVVGQGSRFTIHLPLTLAIVRAVLVEAGGGTYVLPLGNVIEMLRLGTGDGETTQRSLGGQAVISLRGRTIPLANLADLLCGSAGATRPECIAGSSYVVVTGVGERQVGLCVDTLVGEQEVVIKSVGALLGDIPGLAGATILGDGRVALIVDIAKAVTQVGTARRTVEMEHTLVTSA